MYAVPSDEAFDEQAAEAAELAGFHLEAKDGIEPRPTWFVIRSWDQELRHYRNLVPHLGADQPVISVAPPHGNRIADFPRTVERWRDFCLERLRPCLDASPHLLLGGWSFGGVLALEIARKLESEGRHVALVTMLDTRLPKAHPKEPKPASSLPLAAAQHATRLLEMPSDERLAYLRERLAWQRYHARRRIGEWLAAQRGRPAPIYRRPDGRSSEKRDPSKFSLLQKALWVAYLKYQPRPCAVPVAQFWCADSCAHEGDSSLGWARWLRGAFESVPVPGAHMSLFEAAHAAVLGHALRERLDRAIEG